MVSDMPCCISQGITALLETRTTPISFAIQDAVRLKELLCALG
jgi:hypothetical protein